jgi:hypothetical protein
LMNDVATQDATVVAIQEPQARKIQGRLLTTPMGHHKWTKMVPSVWREGRWAIRSMLWVKKDVEAEQVPVDSPDIWRASDCAWVGIQASPLFREPEMAFSLGPRGYYYKEPPLG